MTDLALSRSMLNDPAYQRLRTAYSTQAKPLALFVGAGLSSPALPTWGGLRDRLVDILRRKAATLAPADARKVAETADSISRMADFWVAFGRLRDSLGVTTFNSEIREILARSSSADVPKLYERAWKLPIQGMVTLNLDSFMVRGFSQAHPGRELKRFTGLQAGNLANILHGQHAFALNMHGIMDDVSSWIFTSEELRSLTSGGSYKLLMDRLLTGYTVLFLGITVDDLAVGGFLSSLVSGGVQHDAHFWLTDRSDLSTDRWAESAGIRVIRYDSAAGHEAVLSAVFEDLGSYVEPEVEAAPVALSQFSVGAGGLPAPDVLVTYPLPELRELLNARASDILAGNGDEDGWESFEDFSNSYAEAIHRAWFTTDKYPNNTLFGYTLEERVAQGAFGRVYRGTDSNGDAVAIKVLLDDIREDMQLRKSFRRGVAAMQILQRSGIGGMVEYRSATEIPAFISMEWISGPNLMEAKSAGLLADWGTVLTVTRDLAVIIRTAHQLPQAVLHRDIRPANVMLRDGYLGQEDWSVVVLDFDLSTYRGAAEKSVIASTSALGYLAPEQLEHRPRESTRNTNVDSFGIGMTLLFLCSGKEPQAFMHLNADYFDVVRSATRSLGRSEWQSLPARVSRLILAATYDRQSERWDVPQIIRELDRLIAAWSDPSAVTAADLIAEELAARVFNSYDWDEDRGVASASGAGPTVDIQGDAASGRIQVAISWSSRGDEQWSKLSKFLAARIPRAVSLLTSGGWIAAHSGGGAHDFRIGAEFNVRVLRRGLAGKVQSLNDAVSIFNFGAV